MAATFEKLDSPMTAAKRPPPLQLLPAFEALLGQPLFLRLTRRFELTDAGEQFFEVASGRLFPGARALHG